LTIAIHTPGNDDVDFSDKDTLPSTTTFANLTVEFTEEEKESQASYNAIKTVLKNVYNDLRSVQTEAKFSGIRQQSYNDEVQSNENYNFYMIITESCLFLLVCFA
jgi:hypothetical protein